MYQFRSTTPHHPTAGFSFVEVLVTAAIVALVFGGLFGAVQAMINLINDSKAKAGATALATERLEYIRSLEYDAVGTDGGVPAGTIPQMRNVTLNNLMYSERVLIEYVDDEADGFGGADSNGILSDFKRIKVEYSWSGRNGTSSLALVSTMVPQGIESTAGGGTIRVYVNDASVLPVAGAAVRFINNTGTTSIDTTRFTDASGIAYLGGAPALSDYEIYVSRAGYSSDGTSLATGTLSSPNQPVVSVVESAITTQYFQIDELSDLTITTVGVPTYASFTDTFTDALLVATTSSTTVSGGEVVLTDVAGTYDTNGVVIAATTTPSPLEEWYAIRFSATTSASTSVAVQLYYDDGSDLALIPDTDLPGNSTGFTSSPIDITTLDMSTYDTLALGAVLSTIDTAETPRLYDWELEHIDTQPSLASIPITVTGAKSLGTDASSAPVFKFANSYTTDGSGEVDLVDIEYDVYTVTVDDPTYDVLEACTANPLTLDPDTSETMTLTLANIAGPFLRVTVTDPSATPLSDASVRLENSGYDVTQTTNLCGQTYFTGGGLYAASNYDLTVSKTGFGTLSASTTVSSTSSVTMQISP